MTGVDGGHYGYVIHAPEFALSDYPIAQFEPMDSHGAYLLGASTFEAVETRISFIMRSAQENDSRSPVSFLVVAGGEREAGSDWCCPPSGQGRTQL